MLGYRVLASPFCRSAALLTVFLSLGCTSTHPGAPQPPSSTLLVYVEDAAEPMALPGVTVRVLSQSGAVLVEATTDQFGEVRIPKPSSSLGPWLILADHPAFYIGGTRWPLGFDEICIHLAIWRTCDRVTITAQ